MPEKPIGDIEIGEVVARPVVGPGGNVLVHEGVAITDTLIRVLQRRGIESVDVRGAEEMAAVEAETQYLKMGVDALARHKIEQMRERLVTAFAPHVEDVTMAVLYKSVLDYLTQKYMNESISVEGL